MAKTSISIGIYFFALAYGLETFDRLSHQVLRRVTVTPTESSLSFEKHLKFRGVYKVNRLQNLVSAQIHHATEVSKVAVRPRIRHCEFKVWHQNFRKILRRVSRKIRFSDVMFGCLG